MNTLLKHLMLGGSATALVAGASFSAAFAQNAALEIEEIQSSVSRIDLKGFEAPTPVTVVGIEQINRDAKIQIGELIRELPQVRGGNSIQSGSNTNNLSQVNAGVDSVSIRGLGSARNLVLFDRQRVVTSAIQDGVVDLALIPSGLTQRVDVVTGGASAAWGSDAVTGVINIVINKTFEGFKGNVTYSDNPQINNPTYKASLAWGTSFLGGKGHVVAAADFTISNQGVWDGDVSRAYGNNGRAFVYNSAYCNTANISTTVGTGTCTSPNPGQPYLVYAYGTGSYSAVQGGLVTNHSAGATGSGLSAPSASVPGLKGTMFIGEESTPTSFNYGSTYGTATCYNGCTNDQWTGGGYSPAKQAYHSANYFTYASYQVLPDLKASVQLNYARLTTRAQGGTASSARTIYADNPYLPQEIAQRFVCNGTLSSSCVNTLSNGYNPYTRANDSQTYSGSTLLTLSLAQRQARPTQNLAIGFDLSGNRPTPSASGTQSREAVDYNYNEFCDAILQNCAFYYKQFLRGTFQLEGSIGDSWTWTAYIGHSESRIRERVTNLINVRLNNSLDAVRITSGNVGTSGLPVGSIQCRALLNIAQNASPVASSNTIAASLGITTAGEAAGCAPFNPFGDGEITNAARNYIKPGINPDKNGGNTNTLLAKMQQEAGAFTVSGVLPWALPAGEVGVAYGAEWRLERHGYYEMDRYALAAMYPSGNFGSLFEGKQHVEEGFLEVQMPILKDTFVQNLNFDMAGRITNYSNSGLVETWKLGLQSQIIDDVKARLTWSHDIRAPTIWDIAAPGALALQSCAAFVPGPAGSQGSAGAGTNYTSCYAKAGGNATLNPERANTIAAGLVFTPTFLDGLTASLDWYQIHLSGGITTPAFGDVIARCRSGETVYCSSLTFVDTNSGVSYAYPAGTMYAISFVQLKPVNAGGYTTAGFDFNVAYGFDLFTGSMDVSFNGNYNYDFSRTLNGVTFQGAGGNGYYSGGAEFQGNLNLNYREGAWSFGVQARITGDLLLNLGTQGIAAISEQRVTYVNGVPTLTSGERNLLLGAETNYQAYRVTTDVRVQYRWSNNITLFANVDNIQNLPFGGFNSRRNYRVGVRFNY